MMERAPIEHAYFEKDDDEFVPLARLDETIDFLAILEHPAYVT